MSNLEKHKIGFEQRNESLEAQKEELNRMYINLVEKYKSQLIKDSQLLDSQHQEELSAYKLKIGDCRRILNDVIQYC